MATDSALPIIVNRCECTGKSFAELLAIARDHDIRSVQKLRRHVGNRSYCFACAPFLHEMLKTGYTEFELLDE